jgi:hypothetical protein
VSLFGDKGSGCQILIPASKTKRNELAFSLLRIPPAGRAARCGRALVEEKSRDQTRLVSMPCR